MNDKCDELYEKGLVVTDTPKEGESPVWKGRVEEYIVSIY